MSTGSHVISPTEASRASWIGAALAIVILIARLVAHRQLRRTFDTVAFLVACSIVVLVARTVCNALVLHWGDVNTPTGSGHGSSKRISSVLVLCARCLVTTYYWLQSVLLLLFYRDLMYHIAYIHKAIKLCWFVIGLTYLAVILATFLECRPVTHYWTTGPDGPYQCTQAYVQILLQCVANLAIDILLLLITAPILKAQARVFPRNLQLGLLYILGTFCIIVIVLKIYFIYKDQSVQHARSFWASVQVVVSTFVANAPSIYGAIKNVKRRRSSVMTLARIRTGESDFLDVSGKPPILNFPQWKEVALPRPSLARLGKA